MSRPKLLDLFCGAGGAGEGYRRAGFDVVGVDIEMHDYPCGEFVVADALAVLNDAVLLSEFDAIHASPPCQGYTTMSAKHPTAQAEWPKLIQPVREALQAWGGAYVIENVLGAKREMRSPVMLSGGMFDLHVDRPRLFESNVALTAPPRRKPDHIVGVYGRAHDGRRLWTRSDGSTLRAAKTLLEGQRAMGGMYWMNWPDLTEAIPSQYTEHIGRQIILQLGSKAAA